MHLSICLQDPTFTGTTYLYEAILTAAERSIDWRGLFAFVTRDGVDHLIEDKIVQSMMSRGGEIDLVVGIDAVTNRATLERMQELERHHANFRPRIFWHESGGLFHPKISDFRLENGGRILIVGSGNLTPGGLMRNFEAYTIITADRGDRIDFGALEEFLQRHSGDIKPIDEDALERAARNITRPMRRARRAVVSTPQRPRVSTITRPATGFNRILIAQVPRAGGRWAQVHFNAHVINDYFRLSRLDTQRVYLTHVLTDGSRGEVEVRPCVYSADSNRNHKLEIGAARNRDYPADDRPLLVFRELQLRTYDYMLLMPGEKGYGSLLDLSGRLPSPGAGLARPVTDVATLERAWPDCPLLDDSGAYQRDV